MEFTPVNAEVLLARLTKTDIERNLLSGATVRWREANGTESSLALNTPQERRLFAFLLGCGVRSPVGLTQDFTQGLTKAFQGSDDPAALPGTAGTPPKMHPWKLHSIEAEGFGGLNTWGGPTFSFDFDGQSILIEGPNGSGKSSLNGAMLWALLGERPRDQAESPAHQPKPVFGMNDKQAGSWPPLACYPPSLAEINSPPQVRVGLTFKNPPGAVAKVERTLKGGEMRLAWDLSLEVPPIFIETGMLMPARLAQLRLDAGGSRLTEAVQKLAGLDDLLAVGALVDGLCHRSREYLAFNRKELESAKDGFVRELSAARKSLAPVEISVEDFKPINTSDTGGAMALFGRMLSDRSAHLSQVIASDIAADLDLSKGSVRNRIISAVGASTAELDTGLGGLPSWSFLQSIAAAVDESTASRLRTAVATAQSKVDEALDLFARSQEDSRFQLKALAARWHTNHASGPVADCPLCGRALDSIPSLAKELEELRSIGEAATRAFEDNIASVAGQLKVAVPAAINKCDASILSLEPNTKLLQELSGRYVEADRYSKVLIGFSRSAKASIDSAPVSECISAIVQIRTGQLESLDEQIAIITKAIDLATWFRAAEKLWLDWWSTFSTIGGQNLILSSVQGVGETTIGVHQGESPRAHLARLSDAVGKAAPFQEAAESMRKAWKLGKSIVTIERELESRAAIAQSLAPLKALGSLAEGVARNAIEDLSERISAILKRIYSTERLQFRSAQLRRKSELLVTGGFVPDVAIDATLVANTSWLRAVLWAFIFSLREEAAEYYGTDPFPLLAFDDPQATFDHQHRHRWAQYIADLQNGPNRSQVILTTCDEMFLEQLKIAGVVGREATIVSAGSELGHVGILEGTTLERKWEETRRLNTPKAAREYMSSVRVYAEGILQLMLRGEGPEAAKFVIGKSREKLRQLHSTGVSPWNRSAFDTLVGHLGNNIPQVKHIEMAHHASGANLGMAEACDVQKYWDKHLRPSLETGFRIARDYHLLHGGLKALFRPVPVAVLPEGYRAKVRSIPVQVHGRASALSHGRFADGCVDLDEFAPRDQEKVVLGHHAAYRLAARTLEPVARAGDILLVKLLGEPSAKSLVVALSGDRILARRYEISDNDSDTAVLTAQSINPRTIAPPLVAHRAALALHKVIGVLYDPGNWSGPLSNEQEVCDCGGDASIASLTKSTLGLIEISGNSAEPLALNGQYLILKEEVTAVEVIRSLDGRPIIAADSHDNRYFKRLRITPNNNIVLESLEGGGEYGPVVLAAPGTVGNCLERVWPVAGVLFELPN